MSTSAIEIDVSNAVDVTVTGDRLTVERSDDSDVSVLTAWYPRLVYAEQAERDNWQRSGQGGGIHWEAIDEDLGVEGLLAGKPAGESQRSFKRWLSGCPNP